jgi:hypothetical protein
MDSLIEEGRLRASIEVYNELHRKDDDLFNWCKSRKASLFVDIDEECQNAVTQIMGRYPRLVDTTRGRSGADPFVVGLAKTSDPAMTVVTEENEGKVRIPDVCNAERLRWIRVADLIEQEDWRF